MLDGEVVFAVMWFHEVEQAVANWLEMHGDSLSEDKPQAMQQVLEAARGIAKDITESTACAVSMEEVLAIWALFGVV